MKNKKKFFLIKTGVDFFSYFLKTFSNSNFQLLFLLKVIQFIMSPEEIQCPICIEFIEKDDLSFFPCAHPFHQECLERLLQTSNECPICKTLYEEVDIANIKSHDSPISISDSPVREAVPVYEVAPISPAYVPSSPSYTPSWPRYTPLSPSYVPSSPVWDHSIRRFPPSPHSYQPLPPSSPPYSPTTSMKANAAGLPENSLILRMLMDSIHSETEDESDSQEIDVRIQANNMSIRGMKAMDALNKGVLSINKRKFKKVKKSDTGHHRKQFSSLKGMTVDEYYKKYGLTFEYGIQCDSCDTNLTTLCLKCSSTYMCVEHTSRDLVCGWCNGML